MRTCKAAKLLTEKARKDFCPLLALHVANNSFSHGEGRCLYTISEQGTCLEAFWVSEGQQWKTTFREEGNMQIVLS